jgi:hypothetical protein
LGIGDWGLGVGPKPPNPNPQTPTPKPPIPNPQSPYFIFNEIKHIFIYFKILKYRKIIN